MYAVFNSIKHTLTNDNVISSLGGVLWMTFENDNEIKAKVSRFPIILYHLGISQTSSAGVMNPNGYFAILIRSKKSDRLEDYVSRDFVALGEYIINLLHRSRHGGQSVIFSKCIIAYSSFMLQNSNRRINVTAEEGEIVQVLFFWTNRASIESLDTESQSIAHISAMSSSSGTSSGRIELCDIEAQNAIRASSEIFP